MQGSGLFGVRAATNIEVALIALVMFFLPLFEAPKNSLSVLFVIVSAFYAMRKCSVGCASPFDLPIFGLCAILWVAPFFSEFGDQITPLNSAPRWTLLAVFVLAAARLDYSRTQTILIMASVVVGGVVAIVESLWVWNFNGKLHPEFRSVGHVNHSMMYALIPLAASVGFLCMRGHLLRFLGLSGLFSTIVFLPASRSLVSGVAVIAILLVGIVVHNAYRRSARGVVVAMAAAAVGVSGFLAAPPSADFRGELVSRISGDNIFSDRDKILNSALAVWRHHPVLGTGWSSFGVVTSEEEVRSALDTAGFHYDPSAYEHYSHGHNLWTTILIERGVLGVLLVTLLLFLYLRTFLRLCLRSPRMEQFDHGVAMAALLVAVGFTVAGLGNTTMMNEHGHAGMALIAVCYGYLRSRSLTGAY